MAELIYRKLYTLFWRDPDVRTLAAAEKLIAAYILTSPQSNGCGIFAFSPGMAAEDTGLGTLPETLPGTLPQTLGVTFAEAFQAVVDKLGWKWDPEARVLYIPRWWKWNPPDNPNTLKGAMGRLHDVPQTPLLQEFAANMEYLKPTLHVTFRKRLAERYPKPSRTQGTGNREQGTGIDHKDSCFKETSAAQLTAQEWVKAADWAERAFWAKEEDPWHPKPSRKDRVLLVRVAMLFVAGQIAEHAIRDGVTGLQRSKRPPRSRMAVFRSLLQKECAGFEERLQAVGQPPEELLKGDEA